MLVCGGAEWGESEVSVISLSLCYSLCLLLLLWCGVCVCVCVCVCVVSLCVFFTHPSSCVTSWVWAEGQVLLQQGQYVCMLDNFNVCMFIYKYTMWHV